MATQLIEQTTTAVPEQDEQLEAMQAALRQVEGMLAEVTKNLEKKTGSSTDFCRLIQMQIDLQTSIRARNVKEVRATWVDPEYLKN